MRVQVPPSAPKLCRVNKRLLVRSRVALARFGISWREAGRIFQAKNPYLLSDRVCGDLMPDRGRSVANLEGTCVLENVLVGERPALMLAHMLHPRIDDKVFDVAFWPFRIEEQPPEIRAVAPPDYSKLQHRLFEFACSCRIDRSP